MSNMATKSDFAQKLLTDLRQRKERMAAAHYSSRPTSQTSRVTRGNSGQTSRGARQINVLESTSCTTGKPSRTSSAAAATGGRSMNNINESSNQIVLYEGSRQSSRQVRDLQMAIAAFENSGNLTTFCGSTTNPLVNFFNRFGRKSQKMETTTTTFYKHRSPGQIPTVSHIHINEISKGVHKLNQILTSCCSNGLNLDRNSIEIGRELLKGAINLEESLRMLVNLQDASEYYATSSQKKSRLKLVDVDEEDEKNYEKEVEQWKLNRPRFSFDKNSSLVHGAARQKQLALTYGHEPDSDQTMSCNKNSSSLKSNKEKARISNIVAKLMGLEELPQKQGNVSGEMGTKKKMNSSREPDRHQLRQDLRMQEVGTNPKPAAIQLKKQQNHTHHGEDKHTKMVVSNARNQPALHQERATKRADESKPKQKQKQNVIGRNQDGRPVERMINPPKSSKRSADVNVQKLSVKPNQKAPLNRRRQESRPPTEKKAILQKRDVAMEVRRREIPEKLEAVMSRRNVAVKRPASMLKDLKQQMQSKTRMDKEGKEKLETKDDEMIVSNSVADEIQNQDLTSKVDLNASGVGQEQHTAVKGEEEEVEKHDQSIEVTELDLPQQEYKQLPSLNRQEQLQLQLTEPEKNLKETVIKSQLFLSTAEALFKLNIPLSFLHAGGDHHDHQVTDKNLLLDTAYELLKRKARRHELTYHPTVISNTKLRTLDDLVRQLCSDMEKLKSYGINGGNDGDIAAELHQMLNRDIYGEDPNVNCMWDLEWSRMVSMFGEMEDVVRDVERQMMTGLLDEIANELLVVVAIAV